MTGASLAAALIERGLDPSERDAKQRLFDLVLDGHSALDPSRGARTHAWWVPGRLEVFGKHTDYAGGRTLVTVHAEGRFDEATAVLRRCGARDPHDRPPLEAPPIPVL